MSYTLGRVIDHIDIRVSDAEVSLPFYHALFTALGFQIEELGNAINTDEVYVTAVGPSGIVTRGLHLCFQARDQAMVEAFHKAGLANGGRDNGAPGLRDYHPGYYAAFVLDPDGNNIEAKVDEQAISRSTPAVTVTTA